MAEIMGLQAYLQEEGKKPEGNMFREHVIEPEFVDQFCRELAAEERSRATIGKYRRDVLALHLRLRKGSGGDGERPGAWEQQKLRMLKEGEPETGGGPAAHGGRDLPGVA